MATKDTYSYLTAHGVKPSVQRLAVMGYLLDHLTHPTADEIYQALIGEIPTLSKATVYNTLRLLVEKGAVLQLTIDERKTCYDAIIEPHAHFMCRRCGRVFDVELKRKSLIGAAMLPKGFTADSTELYIKGICPDCQTLH